MEREIKVDLTSLGGPKSYVGWRWATETALGSSNVDMDLADQFIEDASTSAVSTHAAEQRRSTTESSDCNRSVSGDTTTDVTM